MDDVVFAEGEVEIHGRVGSLLEVGTGFHPDLTGRENIFLNGAILGMRKAEIQRKFDDIVRFAEIDEFIDTPVRHYSSGMYVRLGFAVAAHMEPEILIVDEVLAVGDVQFQRKCLGKLDDVARSGRTVLPGVGSVEPDNPMWVDFAHSMAPMMAVPEGMEKLPVISKVLGSFPALTVPNTEISASSSTSK